MERYERRYNNKLQRLWKTKHPLIYEKYKTGMAWAYMENDELIIQTVTGGKNERKRHQTR